MLEKVRANKETEQKKFQEHIQKILNRSNKQEQACVRLQQKNKFFKQEKDQKTREKRDAAMNRVRELMDRKLEQGEQYYEDLWRDIESRRESRVKRERAQSAQIFNVNRLEKEYMSLGVTIGAVNRVVGSNRKS